MTILNKCRRFIIIYILQSAIAFILICFVQQILSPGNSSTNVFSLLFISSYNIYRFDILIELVQLMIFTPMIILTSSRILSAVSSVSSFLVIRHRLSLSWYIHQLINLLFDAIAIALATICTFLTYSFLFIKVNLEISLSILVLYFFSMILGIMFYNVLIVLITNNLSIIFLNIISSFVILFGKLLLHIFPDKASFLVLSSLYVNHLSKIDELVIIELKDKMILYYLFAIDISLLLFFSALCYYFIRRKDIIRREV